jgi:hypothetical protein
MVEDVKEDVFIRAEDLRPRALELVDLLPPPNAIALWRGIPTLSAVAHVS